MHGWQALFILRDHKVYKCALEHYIYIKHLIPFHVLSKVAVLFQWFQNVPFLFESPSQHYLHHQLESKDYSNNSFIRHAILWLVYWFLLHLFFSLNPETLYTCLQNWLLYYLLDSSFGKQGWNVIASSTQSVMEHHTATNTLKQARFPLDQIPINECFWCYLSRRELWGNNPLIRCLQKSVLSLKKLTYFTMLLICPTCIKTKEVSLLWKMILYFTS